MGLTEKHWLEDEELTEYKLEDAIRNNERVYKLGYLAKNSEIVRCKACKHYKFDQGICLKGHVHGHAETWFCADGEKTEPEAPKVIKFCGYPIYSCPRCGEMLTRLEMFVKISDCEKCGQKVKWDE